MDYRVVTGRERNDIEQLQRPVIEAAWPEFMNHDVYINRYWVTIYRSFPEYQFALIEENSDRVLAVGNALPLVRIDKSGNLPDGGLDWALEHCYHNLDSEKNFDTLCAFQIVVVRELLGKGLSYDAVKEMMRIGRDNGLKKLIAPVRPSLKSKFPLIPMQEYIAWKNEEGLPFDGWMRVHARLGATALGICSKSMLIEGTPDEWERWTGMKFPESGEFVVPGALVPVRIDRENGKGIYIEPNVWMVHTL